uniref:kelch-like protein 42 n=1 Tax=Myxine glutinosa TaxID=7769 RepID=UPI00358E399A
MVERKHSAWTWNSFIVAVIRCLQAVSICLWLLFHRVIHSFKPVTLKYDTADAKAHNRGLDSSFSGPKVYPFGDEDRTMSIHCRGCDFVCSEEKLTSCSGYFRALFHSPMKESLERYVDLSALPKGPLESILDCIHGQKSVAFEELKENDFHDHIAVADYLAAVFHLQACSKYLCHHDRAGICINVLRHAQAFGCQEMVNAIEINLSFNFLELASIVSKLPDSDAERLRRSRSTSVPTLCVVKKECAEGLDKLGENSAYLYRSVKSQPGTRWRRQTRLPFAEDKWNISSAVLDNYLFVFGGCRRSAHGSGPSDFVRLGWRYNPLTNTWKVITPMHKQRRRFSAVAVAPFIFALGGWYLASPALSPDVGTRLYTTVERYDPIHDRWSLVAPLPVDNFALTLTHDLPLATSHKGELFVGGIVTWTREKLLLRYDAEADRWDEVLPSLPRVAADMPVTYALVSLDRIYIVGGSNSGDVAVPFDIVDRRWAFAVELPKLCLTGQAVVMPMEGHDVLLMPTPDHNRVAQIDVMEGTARLLDELPFPSTHDALLALSFLGEMEGSV